jgi:hypothetical protein
MDFLQLFVAKTYNIALLNYRSVTALTGRGSFVTSGPGCMHYDISPQRGYNVRPSPSTLQNLTALGLLHYRGSRGGRRIIRRIQVVPQQEAGRGQSTLKCYTPSQWASNTKCRGTSLYTTQERSSLGPERWSTYLSRLGTHVDLTLKPTQLYKLCSSHCLEDLQAVHATLYTVKNKELVQLFKVRIISSLVSVDFTL